MKNLLFIFGQEILSAYGNERLNRTRKISTWREGLASGVQDSNNRYPQFELQVVRESTVSSVAAHENEAFAEESNHESPTQDFLNKAARESSGDYSEKIRDENNQSNGTAKDARNDTKPIQKSSNSQVCVIVCFSNHFTITKVGNHPRLITGTYRRVRLLNGHYSSTQVITR